MKIPKINFNRIKTVINPFSKVKQPAQTVFLEAEPDVFAKSPKAAFEYLSEIVPSTEELLQNLNAAFEKGKASIEPVCKAETKYVAQRAEIYAKRQEELMKQVRKVLENSENKKGVKAVIQALTQNDKFFIQNSSASYPWMHPKRRYDEYTSSAQYIIDSLRLYADTPEKLNIIYKFIKNADFKGDSPTKEFYDCLKSEKYTPVEGRLKLMDKFASEKFMPRWLYEGYTTRMDQGQWYYTKNRVFDTLKDLKYPEQVEFLDKLTNVNDKGATYSGFYYHIKDYNPEQAKYMSKLFDEEKSFTTFGLARFCHTPESFALLRKYATSPHRSAHTGASMDVEIDLMRQLLENMDAHPKVVNALNRFLDDYDKYSKTALDRDLYTLLLAVEYPKLTKYLDAILNNPKLHNTDIFFTRLFLARDKNVKEMDKIIKEFGR